jgi:hypothetical protein
VDDSELIDAFLLATSDLSTREASALIGVSHGTVTRWRTGVRTPVLAATRRAVRAYLNEREAPTAAPAEVPDLPDGAFLKPRARAYYHERVGDYLTRGWPSAVVYEAARSLISALDGGAAVRDGGAGRSDELSEDDQLLALTAGAGHVEKYIGARWKRA